MSLIRLRGVVKAYGGLRPLRVADLSVEAGEAVVAGGLDETAASVLVDLVTGTMLPDEGDVSVGGLLTSSITDHEAWLVFLEQFGIVNPRVVLLDDLTVLQNVALPLTLDLDPLVAPARDRALELAALVGLPPAILGSRLGLASPLDRYRVRLARAAAHAPRVLLLEHPTVGLSEQEVAAGADALRAVAAGGRAILALSNDARFGERAAGRRLEWVAATGRMTEAGVSGVRRWFRKG